MNNEADSPFLRLPPRNDVIGEIINIFARVTGFIEPHEVSPTSHIVKDFHIHTDDLSIFADEVEKHFGIKTPPGEWPIGFEPTIDGIANFVLFHLAQKK